MKKTKNSALFWSLSLNTLCCWPDFTTEKWSNFFFFLALPQYYESFAAHFVSLTLPLNSAVVFTLLSLDYRRGWVWMHYLIRAPGSFWNLIRSNSVCNLSRDGSWFAPSVLHIIELLCTCYSNCIYWSVCLSGSVSQHMTFEVDSCMISIFCDLCFSICVFFKDGKLHRLLKAIKTISTLRVDFDFIELWVLLL